MTSGRPAASGRSHGAQYSRNRSALSGSQATPASDSNAISAAQAAW